MILLSNPFTKHAPVPLHRYATRSQSKNKNDANIETYTNRAPAHTVSWSENTKVLAKQTESVSIPKSFGPSEHGGNTTIDDSQPSSVSAKPKLVQKSISSSDK